MSCSVLYSCFLLAWWLSWTFLPPPVTVFSQPLSGPTLKTTAPLPCPPTPCCLASPSRTAHWKILVHVGLSFAPLPPSSHQQDCLSTFSSSSAKKYSVSPWARPFSADTRGSVKWGGGGLVSLWGPIQSPSSKTDEHDKSLLLSLISYT